MSRTSIGLFSIIVIALVFWGVTHDRSQPEEEAPAPIVATDTMPLDQLSENVIPQHYTLDLTLIPQAERFNGTVVIDIVINEPADHIWLHGQGLNVTKASLTIGGQALTAAYRQEHKSGIAKVSLPKAVSGRGSLLLEYDAPFSTSLDAIYKVKESGNNYLFSQMEAISARMALPSFDEPRFKTPFDITVAAPQSLEVIGNTPETGSEPAAQGLTRHRFATTKPLPTYLLAFAVGDFDIVEWEALPPTAVRDRPIPLRGVAVKGKGEKLRYALDNTRPILEALEHYFGVPYPYAKLDILAAPDFAFGAMENVGAIVYREQLLLLEENAPLEQKRAYGAVHAHELAHQWFGNLVTPKWWDDIWLNESFATWMEYKAAQTWKPEFDFTRALLEEAHGAMSVDARASARQIRQPIASNDDIMNAFDSITYRKGGGVLQMFESYLGEEGFRSGVQLHMKRFRFAAADVHDFMQSLAEGAANAEVVPAFESFLFQPGVPMVELTLACQNGKSQMNLLQHRYVPLGVTAGPAQRWKIPLCYKTDRGSDCTLVTEAEQQLELNHCPDYLMPNNQGAGYYHWSLEDAGWQALLTHAEALDASDKLSLVHNLRAAFRAAKLPSETLLRAFEVVAEEGAWDVVSSPISELESLRRILLDEKPTQNYKAFVKALYRPHYERLGLWPDTATDKQDSIGAALLRRQVVDALAMEARDGEVREALKNMALAYLGGNGQSLHPEAANADLLHTALTVAVEEGEADFAERLLQMALSSTDAIFRQDALNALVHTNDQAMARRLADELLLADTVRSNEAQMLIHSLMRNPTTRQYTWNWLQQNIDPFLKRYSSFSINRVVSVASYFCDPASRRDVEVFYKSVENKIAGAPRKLAETLEVIDQCIALKAEKAEAFKQALKEKI